ncbi:hypothetical protein BZU93_27695 [Salmonella enterica subsp. enterica]|nr:hypothetical protein [Salmonella enterica subsp. enterica serovar Enteritidis]
MAADYARGGGGFSVKNETHIHNNAGVQVTEERSDDGNGNTRTDITIERVVAGAITRQGGAPNRALKALGVGTGPRISRG